MPIPHWSLFLNQGNNTMKIRMLMAVIVIALAVGCSSKQQSRECRNICHRAGFSYSSTSTFGGLASECYCVIELPFEDIYVEDTK